MITILDIAKFRGIKKNNDGHITMAEFDRVGLPMMGGCEGCNASIACYNSYPSKSGYLRCGDCITENMAFATVEEFETWVKQQETEDAC